MTFKVVKESQKRICLCKKREINFRLHKFLPVVAFFPSIDSVHAKVKANEGKKGNKFITYSTIHY